MDLRNEKELVEEHHKRDHKILVVGQPLAGKDVPKATYMSCLNVLGPSAMIHLLEKHKVASTIKILGDFPMDANRNRFVEESIAAGADYLFFMDMDMTFPANALTNLFEVISDERPVVSGMYYLKREPYSPVMGRYVDWDDNMHKYKDEYYELGFVHPKSGDQLCMWRSFTYFDKTVPFTADVIGLGCVLMKTSVFKKMERPFFHYTRDPRPESGFKQMDEVMPFCAKMKKMGIPIYIDPRVQCGHIMTMESNVDLFSNYRDSSFGARAKMDPKGFDEMSRLFVDVREEQRNGSRIETQPSGSTNSEQACGTAV